MATRFLNRFDYSPKSKPLIRFIDWILSGNNKKINKSLDTQQFIRDHYCFFAACHVGDVSLVKQMIEGGIPVSHEMNFDGHVRNAIELVPHTADPLIIKMIAEKSDVAYHEGTIIHLFKGNNLDHVKAFFDNVKGAVSDIFIRWFGGTGFFRTQCIHDLNILQTVCCYGTPEMFDYIVKLPGVAGMIDSELEWGSSLFSLISIAIGNKSRVLYHLLRGGNTDEILFLRSKYLHKVNDDIFQVLFTQVYPGELINEDLIKYIILIMGCYNKRNLQYDIFLEQGYKISSRGLRDVIKTCFPKYRDADHVPVPESTVINADFFVLTSAINDGYFTILPGDGKAARFMRIITSLHYDCAVVAINRAFGISSDTIPRKEIEISLLKIKN